MPYRKSQQAKPKRRAKSAPVLDELVKQFSDRYAFLRELVQNAIDAGATKVRVGVARDGDDRTTFVEDDGSGMTLEVIKGPFLTKFSSSKEGDSSKIGRYGVGFLSVFALAPRLVAVETETAEVAHTIEIDPSFAYRVSKRPPLGRKGTRIAIVEAVSDTTSKDADHLALVEHALRRWCRFADVSIELEVGSETRALDCDLTLIAPVVAELDEAGTRILVGPTRGTMLLPGVEASAAGDFAGYYSRGLTLVEATSGPHIIEGLRYRVDCAGLAHTISRDDVVHNSAYAHAKQRVRELADTKLPKLVHAALSAAAHASGASGIIAATFPALLRAGHQLLPEDSLMVPIVGTETPCPLHAIGARAKAPDAITAELGRRGLKVALDPTGNAVWLPETIKSADQLLTHIVGRFALQSDAFATALLSTLWAMGLEVDRALLADAADVDGRAARIVRGDDLRPEVDGSVHVFLPRAGGSGLRVLLLFTKEPALAAAMRLPPARGALLAARVVWLEERGELPRRVNLDLLDASRAIWSGT